MNANKKGRPVGKTISPAEPPRRDDILDLIKAFEETDLEGGGSLDNLEEVSEEEFADHVRRRREQWAALSREEKQLRLTGEAILQRLILCGMRQAELARRLGKDRAWVSRVVRGNENLTLRTLCQLATVLECDLSDLLCPATGSVPREAAQTRS